MDLEGRSESKEWWEGGGGEEVRMRDGGQGWMRREK